MAIIRLLFNYLCRLVLLSLLKRLELFILIILFFIYKTFSHNQHRLK